MPGTGGGCQVLEDASLHKLRIISDSMSTLQKSMQNLHPSQQVANSDKKEIVDAQASHTERRCHLTFTWCPSHPGVRGNELAGVAPKEVTTEEQEGESYHYDSAKAAIRQETKEHPITHNSLRHTTLRKRREWHCYSTARPPSICTEKSKPLHNQSNTREHDVTRRASCPTENAKR